MQSFLTKIVSKFNNKVLAIFSAALGFIAFLIGIFTIADDAKMGAGIFINDLIAAALFFILAFFLYKSDKKKSLVLAVLLTADFVVTSFGNSISTFVGAGDLGQASTQLGVDSGLEIATSVFQGIAYMAIFAATLFVLIMLLSDKVNKETFHFLAECLYFVSAVLFVIAGILMLCSGGSGLSIVTAFFGELFLAGQAIFFAAAFYHLLNE